MGRGERNDLLLGRGGVRALTQRDKTFSQYLGRITQTGEAGREAREVVIERYLYQEWLQVTDGLSESSQKELAWLVDNASFDDTSLTKDSIQAACQKALLDAPDERWPASFILTQSFAFLLTDPQTQSFPRPQALLLREMGRRIKEGEDTVVIQNCLDALLWHVWNCEENHIVGERLCEWVKKQCEKMRVEHLGKSKIFPKEREGMREKLCEYISEMDAAHLMDARAYHDASTYAITRQLASHIAHQKVKDFGAEDAASQILLKVDVSATAHRDLPPFATQEIIEEAFKECLEKYAHQDVDMSQMSAESLYRRLNFARREAEIAKARQ